MKPATSEWIAKAEGDLRTAERELSVTDEPNRDAVCFHSQQCAEKYLKAALIEAGGNFPKTHDLGAILELLLPIESSLESLREEVNSLTDRAVEVRYPGYFADEDDARESLAIAHKVRAAIRSHLGLQS
jgi:HEPN domain-containing protein